ncbi:Sodium-coupled monocarboxylate transporter 1, partial [Armadillidium nasatum]
MEEKEIFSVLDYVLFFGLLCISIIIGIVSAFKGNRSPEEFLLGNRSLNPFVVSMSLLTSFVSATNLVGLTTEVYLHGSQLSMMSIGCVLGISFALIFGVPIIFPLRLTSILEYYELRFRTSILPQILLLIVSLSLFVNIGVCLFATAIALSTVTPFGYETCILIMGVGGMRAVVWTDLIQFIVMMVGILIYIIAGVIQAGGLGNVISIAEKGQRLEFFNMNPSLYERHNFYNTIIFGAFFHGSIFSLLKNI